MPVACGPAHLEPEPRAPSGRVLRGEGYWRVVGCGC